MKISEYDHRYAGIGEPHYTLHVDVPFMKRAMPRERATKGNAAGAMDRLVRQISPVTGISPTVMTACPRLMAWSLLSAEDKTSLRDGQFACIDRMPP